MVEWGRWDISSGFFLFPNGTTLEECSFMKCILNFLAPMYIITLAKAIGPIVISLCVL